MNSVTAFLMSIFSFWRTDLPMDRLDFSQPSELVRYQQGLPAHREAFDQTHGQFQNLKTYLEARQGRWKVDVTTHAPVVLIQNPNFTINCREIDAVVTFKTASGENRQLLSDFSNVPFCGLKMR